MCCFTQRACGWFMMPPMMFGPFGGHCRPMHGAHNFGSAFGFGFGAALGFGLGYMNNWYF